MAMQTYLWTGQDNCYDMNGTIVPCDNTGQDGEFRTGMPWPQKRFAVAGEIVRDRLTGLLWLQDANPGGSIQTRIWTSYGDF